MSLTPEEDARMAAVPLVIDREYLARRLATLREAEAYCRFGGADGVLTAAGLLRSVISTLEITASLPALPERNWLGKRYICTGCGTSLDEEDGSEQCVGCLTLMEPTCSSCGDILPDDQTCGMCADCAAAEQRLIEADLRAAQMPEAF